MVVGATAKDVAVPELSADSKVEPARALPGDRVGPELPPATGHSHPPLPPICDPQPSGGQHEVPEDLDMGVRQKTGSRARTFQKHARSIQHEPRARHGATT